MIMKNLYFIILSDIWSDSESTTFFSQFFWLMWSKACDALTGGAYVSRVTHNDGRNYDKIGHDRGEIQAIPACIKTKKIMYK